MDIKSSQSIKYYKSCDELPMFNWEKLKQTGDLNWLCVEFDGYNHIKADEKAKGVYEDILDEYSKLSKNNQAIQYYDLLIDISDAQSRIGFATIFIMRLNENPTMPEATKKGMIEELRQRRFYINESRPLHSELKRIDRQLGQAQMKLNALIKEKEQKEKATGKATPILKVKQRVENIIKRSLDFKKISVSEWIYILEDLPKKKVA